MTSKFAVVLFILSSTVFTEQRELKTKHALDQDSLNFLIAGDFGGWSAPLYTTQAQLAVAQKMGETASIHNASFVIANGDNFYHHGVQSARDKSFKFTFEDVYSASSLQIPWYPTMGNIDYKGSGQAQLDYSHLSDRWTYPDFWYTVDYTLTPTNTNIRILMLDTVIPFGRLCQEGQALNVTMAEEQWQWLEKELQESQSADYLVVVGHYPVVTAGPFGPIDKVMYSKLSPLFEKYRVSAYICGHEHNMQHVKDAAVGSTTEYFVVGCSSFTVPAMPYKHSSKLEAPFTWAEITGLGGCFARVEISPSYFKIVFVQGRDGEEVYSYEMSPRNGNSLSTSKSTT